MCAASNPFRTSDLIAKYGWKVMPYLGNLGSSLLAEAQVLFVDSGHVNASDADDTEHGHSFEKPLATIDYAISLCTGGERSVILVAPGHNEGLDASTIDFDVSDITVIGIGEGSNRPTIDFDSTDALVSIGANNTHLINLRFLPSIDDIVIGVDVETGITGTILEKCEWAEMEDTGDEFILGLDIKSGCTDTKVTNCLFRTEVTADAATHAIKLTGASDNVIIEKSRFIGNWSVAAIGGDTTLSTDVLIDDVTIKTQNGIAGIVMLTGTTGILRNACIESTGLAVDSMIVADAMSWFNNFGVTADGTAAEIIGGGEVIAALNTAVSSVTAGSLWDILSDGVGGGYAKSTDSLEALRTAIDGIGIPTDVTGAIGGTPTLKSLQDILSKAPGSNNYSAATDSLEAIRDYIDGTTALDGITLDHLLKTTTTKTLDQDLTVYTADFSVMAHVMSSTAVGSTFKASTDSLEAIAAAIAAITDNVATAVPDTAVARSLQDILNKDDSGGFNDATDSLEAIRDHLDGTTVLGGIQLDHLAQTVSAGTNYPTEVTTDSILGMIMSTNGNPSGFNKTTDSLQAISDFVRTGTTLGAGINLDHLLLTTTSVAADGDLSGFITAESVLAHIMAADADVTTSYNASTDSLEAISVALAAGTGSLLALSTNNLDHLAKVTTGLATDGDLSGHVIAGSILSHIMSADADADDTGFNCSTDSLAAIAAALAAGTGATVAIEADNLHKLVSLADGGGNLYPDSPVDDSILSYIMTKANPADITDFDNATDSLEMISDKVGAFAGTNGAGAGESAKAQLTLLYTDTQAIVADTAAIDPGATRLQTRTFTNWTAIANALWTVSAPVKAKIWGIVLVGVKNVGMNLKISTIPTAPGGVINLVANLDCQNDSAGTLYKMNTTLGGAMVEVTGGATLDDGIEVILPAGTVVMDSDAVEDAGGSIQWFIQYEPIEAGAAVSNT